MKEIRYKNPQIFNRMDIQESRENDYLVYTDTELEHDTVKYTEGLENNTNRKRTNIIS